MHKKLAADLTSIAHSILQLKNKEDVLVLKEKAYQVYEKLTLLAYVDEYLNTTPNATETKEELLEKIEKATQKTKEKEAIEETAEEEELEEVVAEKEIEDVKTEEVTEDLPEEPVSNEIEMVEVTETIEKTTIETEEIIEQPFDELEQTLFSVENTTEEIEIKDKKKITLEEELHDTISVEVAAELFEKPEAVKSVNDQKQQNIQIGLNDRIAFVKNLFNGSQEEFNRVVSQLNTIKTEKEAKKFINKMVKPDYNWSEQEEYEARFMALVERKFA